MNKRAFTVAELLISLGIVALIAGGVIIAMSRGASNVHRGSFNALAANQASWIVSIMRSDIARADSAKIVFKTDDGEEWSGKGEFRVVLLDKSHVSYAVENRGSGQVFVRAESGGRKQFFASEYLDRISVKKVSDCFEISMLLKDPAEKANDFTWSARIFPPVPAGTDRFWKPLPGGK